MSEIAVALIIFGIGIIAGALMLLQSRKNGRRIAQERERLTSEVEGHRQEASAHASRADSLGPQAVAHREEAAQHLAQADKLEAQAGRSKRFATRHEAEADERADKLEQL